MVSGTLVSEHREEGIAEESRNMLVLCWGSLGRIASCLVLGKLVTGRREEGIATESRNMLDDLCQIGLRGVWVKLVSEHREEGVAKSSRNVSDPLSGCVRLDKAASCWL